MALDYYVVLGSVKALLVEEFILREDFTTAGLDSAGFDGTWSSSAELSRGVRTEPGLRAVPVGRAGAEAAYRELGGASLAPEDDLRTQFRDRTTFPASEPLRLSADDGRSVYRLLFAKDLDSVEDLCAALRLSPADDPRVAGRAERPAAAWELRRVGGVAWAVDVSFPGAVSGSLLRALRSTAREYGLIPVAVERFA